MRSTMTNRLVRDSAAIGFFALGLYLLTHSAQASPLPNVANLNFVNTATAPKNTFTIVNPTGWTGGSGLIFIDSPGSPGCAACADGPTYLTVYGPFPNPPIPGNFVEADGNPSFESGFNQTITGLVPGTTYTLSFYQAGGQQTTFGNGTPTTEQWIVSLGTTGLTIASGGPVDPVYGSTDVYHSADPSATIVATPLMTTPSGGVTPWQFVTVNLTADATTDLLTFLAWGDKGSTINLPPMVFLSGVNSQNVLAPEPGSVWLLGIALFGLGLGVAMRRRRRQATV
jgi:hypothetical protein